MLDSHISLIYGEAIQPDLMERILAKLQDKGFASSNVLFGVGSYGFLSAGVNGGIATRDTYGFAVKATYAVINGQEHFIFKDPKTDTGVKKSQRGLVAVYEDDYGELSYEDQLYSKDKLDRTGDILEVVFEDGKLLRDESLSEIRSRLGI